MQTQRCNCCSKVLELACPVQILTAELQEMDEEAETLASRTAALAQKMLRRVVAWLNGLDSTSLEQDLDALSKRLSMVSICVAERKFCRIMVCVSCEMV
jgi:hypothetical protein